VNELIETKELVYSIRHPVSGLFWNGSTHEPKFFPKPHRWAKLSDVKRRYADYLVALETKDEGTRYRRPGAWDDCPPYLILVTEQITSTPLSSESLSPIDGDNLVLAKAKSILCDNRADYDNYHHLVRTSGASAYQFMVQPKWDFLQTLIQKQKVSRSAKRASTEQDGETLVDLVKKLGHQRARVVGWSIFVKDQKDLLMLKMQGHVDIDYVYDLFSMEKVGSG
jgi:hypothetical protein